jgi:hypothetical protein
MDLGGSFKIFMEVPHVSTEGKVALPLPYPIIPLYDIDILSLFNTEIMF